MSIKERIRDLPSTSLSVKLLRKESFVPDLYRGSVLITYVIRPGCVWIKSKLTFSRTLPQIGLGLAIFMFALYNPVIFASHLAKFRLGLLLFPALFLAGILSPEVRFPRAAIFDLPLIFFLLLAIISLGTVENIHALFFGLRELMSLGLFIMSIYLVIYIFRKKEIKRLFYLLSLAGMVASFIFIFHLLVFKSGEAYLRNTFGNPNHLAYFLLLIYPLPLAVALDNSRSKYLWNACGILIIVAIFFTFSLGAAISFFLSLPVLVLTFRKKWPLGLLLVIILLSLIFFSFFRHKFFEGLSLGPGSSIMARIEIWKAALGSIYQRPILGIGLGQFAASAKPYYARQMYNAFNVFFHLAAVTGLLGLISFLWFLIRAFKLNMLVLTKGQQEKLYGGAVLTGLSAGILCFLWDTHLLAVMTNWLLGLLFGSLGVMAGVGAKEGELTG